ncbi:SDR family NAD(P)-dependent oxidoreductase [Nannocystis radixulma]|uniref:SDR family NAD(P)-dependent oxidoreductase n=1 Tax=Nannocystis radixulma TaxID=2995305 RepID=A0ABT5BHS7_9BACT|nr:SDR family oxidoreductase [Nannocystis radixulma]MDC0673233.1 SDR family NAD(P)-dependent oxidoreductase [Nannocystis radixulma]
MLALEGLHVLVTGGSRGIGAAACRRFAGAGAVVLVHYRDRHDVAESLLAELRAVHDAPHLGHAADLADPAQVGALFDRVEREWGRLDCLVNNAGVWEPDALARFDVDVYRRTMDVNVLGPFLAVARALPLLRLSQRASIVNVTSTAGQRGEADHSPYAASKGALISATKSWAVELAPGIRVNSVAPGWVDTDMTAGPLRHDPAARARIESQIPLRRVASADDIAAPIVFLASELARHITGEILNVNGGSVLCG